MAKKKVSKRGGYRPGAGRKKGDTALVSWRLQRSTIAAVKAEAVKAGLKPGALVDRIVSRTLGSS
jgi:hypothetical protein